MRERESELSPPTLPPLVEASAARRSRAAPGGRSGAARIQARGAMRPLAAPAGEAVSFDAALEGLMCECPMLRRVDVQYGSTVRLLGIGQVRGLVSHGMNGALSVGHWGLYL